MPEEDLSASASVHGPNVAEPVAPASSSLDSQRVFAPYYSQTSRPRSDVYDTRPRGPSCSLSTVQDRWAQSPLACFLAHRA